MHCGAVAQKQGWTQDPSGMLKVCYKRPSSMLDLISLLLCGNTIMAPSACKSTHCAAGVTQGGHRQ